MEERENRLEEVWNQGQRRKGKRGKGLQELFPFFRRFSVRNYMLVLFSSTLSHGLMGGNFQFKCGD